MQVERRTLTRLGLIVLLAFAAAVSSRALAQDLRYFRHQAWSTEDGLPQDSVHGIAQTPDGFLWVATERGVARFDGIGFAILSSASDPAAFSSNDTCCLAVTTDGDLWIGTSDGLLRRHGSQLQRVDGRDGPSSAAIRGLVPLAANRLLVLTTAGLSTLNGGIPEERLSLPSVDRIVAAGHGDAWLVGDHTLALLHGRTVTPRALPGAGSAAGLVAAAQGSDGALWTATRTAVTLSAKTVTRSWQVGAALAGSRIETLALDRAGNAWVGTNDGLAVLRPDGSAPTPIAALHGNTVLTVFEDREGNEWIGTETSGLHVLRPLSFRTEPLLADRSVTTVAQASDGAVWAGTWNDGLHRLQIGSTQEGVRIGTLTSPVILSLAPGMEGSVWAGTPDGLNHVDRTGHVRQLTAADGLPDEYVESLAGSPDGSVWIGTRQGLAHLHGSVMDVLTRADGLGGDRIGALLLTQKGDLWVATTGGLSRRRASGEITTLARDHDGGIVTALAEDSEGTVWMGTDTGEIARVGTDAAQPAFRPQIAFRPQPAERVMGLVTDAHGSMWVRTRSGFNRIAMADLRRCAAAGLPCSLPVSTYELADGIPSEEVAEAGSPMLWRTTDGEIWGATRRGVAIVNPEQLHPNSLPPGVVIEQLLVGDTPVDLSRQPLALPYSNARLTMEYAGLSYTVPPRVRYRVLLEGYDRTWIDVGGRRSATYTNLPPGTYRFRVQASNENGVWNAQGAELRFRIVPPIYRRWWFLALLFVLLLTLLFWLYQLRLRLLRARFDDVLKERNRIAREIHDTLAQDFVGVSVQLDLIAQLLSLNKPDVASAQIEQTRKLVTDGLKEARQSIWALRSNLGKESLPNELGRLVARYRKDSLAVRLTITGPYRPLDETIEGEVLRVAQEALSNVDRHAGATSAEVTLRYGRDMLMLGIEDDGRGFVLDTAVEREGHYGLRGLRERAGGLGGTLEIVTAPGGGTRVSLNVPIAFHKE